MKLILIDFVETVTDILNEQFYPRELTRSQFPAMQDLAVQPTNHKVKRKQISLPVTEQI